MDHLDGCASDLRDLILRISEVSKTVRKGFVHHQTVTNTKNIYGEQQVAMDKWADDIIVSDLRKSRMVRHLASEERSEIIEFKDASGDIGVTLDPLDGSSLIGTNLAVGTIIGIFRGRVLSPGMEMCAAIYVLYGPLTTLTYTAKEGVHEFVLNDDGNFVLQEENLQIAQGKIYSPGALRKDYLPTHQKFIETLEREGYKLRYSGSFVADVNQILRKGGVFAYPGFEGSARGKLRLLFEANPTGFIVDQAGGAASDGTTNILSILPESISERVPVYIGGKKEIGLIEELNSELV